MVKARGALATGRWWEHTLGTLEGKPRIQDLLGPLVSHARLSARASQSTNSLTLERPPL